MKPNYLFIEQPDSTATVEFPSIDGCREATVTIEHNPESGLYIKVDSNDPDDYMVQTDETTIDLTPLEQREANPKTFLNEFDNMADKAAEAIKAAARRYVAAGAVERSGEIDDLREAKAALCAALSAEVDQWRFRGEQSKAETNFRRF